MVMTLYVDKGIQSITVWDSACRTAQGAHPGMLLSAAEKIYGKVTKINRSEIESRDYATFTHQPVDYAFRLSEGAIYLANKHETERYASGTTVMQISIRK
jgi:hypothetical protein